MTDTLEVFGKEWQNVTGIKAYDDNGQLKAYVRPIGTKQITSNGTGIDVAQYASVDVAVPSSQPSLQSKTKSYTPSETAQSETVQADTGYDGLSSVAVSVGAISSDYVGSGIDRRSSSDLTASGATVTVPSGYYSAQATKSVTSGSAGTPTATKGTVSNHSVSVTPSVTNTTGYITGGTKSGTAVTVSASELVSGNKAITQNGTGIDVTNYATVSVDVDTVNNQSKTKTYTPTKQTQSETVQPDSGYTGLSSVSVTVNPIPSEYIDTTISSDGASASDIANGKKAYVNGSLITGTASGGSSWTLVTSTEMTIAQTSTSNTNKGTVACGSGMFTTDDWIWVRIRDKAGARAGYMYGTDTIFTNANKANGSTSTYSTKATTVIRYSTSSQWACYIGNYGVYAYSLTNSGNIAIYARYNSTNTLTIDGTYVIEVYKLTPPTGKTIFAS